MIRKAAYILLIALGFMKIAGHLTGSKAVKGLSTVFCSSPLPIVFTKQQGIENFAADFYLTAGQDPTPPLITPEVYSRIKGPYNRRNVYGAAIAFAPILPEDFRNRVFQYGLCDPGPLSEELGLHPKGTGDYKILIISKTRGDTSQWNFDIECP